MYAKADDTKIIADIQSQWVIYDDPDTSKKWREAFLKILIGCAELNRRGIYKNTTNHRINCSVLFNFNQPPKIDTVVESVRRRFKFFICNSRFVENPAEVNEAEHIYLAESEYMTVKWRNAHRMAMWHILNEFHIKFEEQNFKFAESEAPLLWNEFFDEFGGSDEYDDDGNNANKKKANILDTKFINELKLWVSTSKFEIKTNAELHATYGRKKHWPYITVNELVAELKKNNWWNDRCIAIKKKWGVLQVALVKLLKKVDEWTYKRHIMRNKIYLPHILIGWVVYDANNANNPGDNNDVLMNDRSHNNILNNGNFNNNNANMSRNNGTFNNTNFNNNNGNEFRNNAELNNANFGTNNRNMLRNNNNALNNANLNSNNTALNNANFNNNNRNMLRNNTAFNNANFNNNNSNMQRNNNGNVLRNNNTLTNANSNNNRNALMNNNNAHRLMSQRSDNNANVNNNSIFLNERRNNNNTMTPRSQRNNGSLSQNASNRYANFPGNNSSTSADSPLELNNYHNSMNSIGSGNSHLSTGSSNIGTTPLRHLNITPQSANTKIKHRLSSTRSRRKRTKRRKLNNGSAFDANNHNNNN